MIKIEKLKKYYGKELVITFDILFFGGFYAFYIYKRNFDFDKRNFIWK